MVLGVFGEVAEAGGLADAVLNIDLRLVERLALLFEGDFLLSTDKLHGGALLFMVRPKNAKHRAQPRGGQIPTGQSYINERVWQRIKGNAECRLPNGKN